jgi:hypothetical protein
MLMMEVFDGLLEATAMRRPMTMVAMWMKKSCQELAAWWAGWTSSIGTCSGELRARYPKMGDFVGLAAKFDSQGKLRNDFLKTNLFGG